MNCGLCTEKQLSYPDAMTAADRQGELQLIAQLSSLAVHPPLAFAVISL